MSQFLQPDQVARAAALFDWTASWTVTTGSSLSHPHFSVLDFFGSVLACEAFRRYNAKTKRSALESIAVCLVLQFGGTTLSNVVVLGQTPGWLTGHTAWAAFLAAWWLTFACPFDLWHRAFSALAPLRGLIELGSAVSLAHSVTSWGADVALAAADPRASASPTCVVLCGALSACGGGLTAHLLSLVDAGHPTQSTKRAAYKGVALNFQRAFLCSFAYYWLRDPHFHWREAHAWLGAGYFSHDAVAARAAIACVVLFLFAWDAIIGGPSPAEWAVAVALRLLHVEPTVGQDAAGTGPVQPVRSVHKNIPPPPPPFRHTTQPPASFSPTMAKKIL